MVALRAVTISGAVAGALVGSVILVFGSPRHYALLWTFFALGTLATRLGYRRKQERKTAQEEGGRRGARHVLANCGVATLICVNLQTSFLTPPFGWALFFLRGVAPPEISTRDIYIGIIPFVVIQLFALVVLWYVPGLATALPHALYGGR